MPFMTAIHVAVPVHEGENWEVISPLMYYSNVRKKRYIVPAGAKSDLASVPRVPLIFWLVGRRGDAAAILHDHLYANGMRLKQIESRVEADDVFYEALLDSGVWEVLAYMMFTAVRAAGDNHFTHLAAAVLLALFAVAGCEPLRQGEGRKITAWGIWAAPMGTPIGIGYWHSERGPNVESEQSAKPKLPGDTSLGPPLNLYVLQPR